jgi:DNA-directed RNA polymerase specialized sigma subunit
MSVCLSVCLSVCSTLRVSTCLSQSICQSLDRSKFQFSSVAAQSLICHFLSLSELHRQASGGQSLRQSQNEAPSQPVRLVSELKMCMQKKHKALRQIEKMNYCCLFNSNCGHKTITRIWWVKHFRNIFSFWKMSRHEDLLIFLHWGQIC